MVTAALAVQHGPRVIPKIRLVLWDGSDGPSAPRTLVGTAASAVWSIEARRPVHHERHLRWVLLPMPRGKSGPSRGRLKEEEDELASGPCSVTHHQGWKPSC